MLFISVASAVCQLDWKLAMDAHDASMLQLLSTLVIV